MNVGQPSGPGHPNAGLATGDTLDRYELLCPLAQGGMAAVWLARLRGKHGFQKLVAVKTIRPEHAGDERFQRMFLDEARIAASITHPNVAQIMDLGEENGVLYLVMEWVEGDSVSKLLRVVQRAGHRMPLGDRACASSPMPAEGCTPPTSCATKGDSCSTWSTATSLLRISFCPARGSPKVIDFGIAKAMGRLAEETSAGVLKGKISYMSPEQALGRSNVDRRADVWAVGSILHMALAGAPPFRAENEVLALCTGSPRASRPIRSPPDVPPQVRAIVARTMAFNVDQRTPDCATLQHGARRGDGRLRGPEQHRQTWGTSRRTTSADSARARQELVQRSIAAASDRDRGARPRMHSSGTPSGFAPVAPRDASSSGAVHCGQLPQQPSGGAQQQQRVHDPVQPSERAEPERGDGRAIVPALEHPPGSATELGEGALDHHRRGAGDGDVHRRGRRDPLHGVHALARPVAAGSTIRLMPTCKVCDTRRPMSSSP